MPFLLGEPSWFLKHAASALASAPLQSPDSCVLAGVSLWKTSSFWGVPLAHLSSLAAFPERVSALQPWYTVCRCVLAPKQMPSAQAPKEKLARPSGFAAVGVL